MYTVLLPPAGCCGCVHAQRLFILLYLCPYSIRPAIFHVHMMYAELVSARAGAFLAVCTVHECARTFPAAGGGLNVMRAACKL